MSISLQYDVIKLGASSMKNENYTFKPVLFKRFSTKRLAECHRGKFHYWATWAQVYFELIMGLYFISIWVVAIVFIAAHTCFFIFPLSRLSSELQYRVEVRWLEAYDDEVYRAALTFYISRISHQLGTNFLIFLGHLPLLRCALQTIKNDQFTHQGQSVVMFQ